MKTFANFDELLEVARREKPKEVFASIVSNPPYQMANDGAASDAVYHLFMQVSQNIGRYVSMIYPSRWRLGGRGEGLIEFRDSESISPKYKVLHDFSSSESFFTNVSIGGGMNYFLWDSNKTDPETELFYNGKCYGKVSGLDMVRDPNHKGITEKIAAQESMTELVSGFAAYGLALRNEGHVKTNLTTADNFTSVYFVSKNSVKSGRVSRSLITQDDSDFKVFVSGTANRENRTDNETGLARTDRIFIGNPGESCTSTFLKVGSFNSQTEAENCLLYLKTDFSNFLMGIITPSQGVSRTRYSLIPNVNFATGEILDKPGTFLDFSKPETLDDQLAAIYNLTEDERNLMKKDLKPWKDKTSVTADM